MTKFYFFTISVLLSLKALTQDAVFYKLPEGLAPDIDGYADDLWADVEEHNIEKPYQYEEPTLDVATWQAVWNDTALFIIVIVEEDNLCPPWCEPAQVDWMSDKVEVWLDVNDILQDGQGPAGFSNGHYQFAPTFEEGIYNYFFSGNSWQGWYYQYAYDVEEPDYVFEYVFPFSSLEDASFNALVPSEGKQIGFDVYVIDRDGGEDIRKRMTWINDGLGPTGDEAWNTMDDCGVVEFSTETIDNPYPPHTGEFFTYCDFESISPKTGALGDDKWTCTRQLEGFKLGIGGGDYIWQPVINNITFSEKELFVVAGQGMVKVEYSYIGTSGIGTTDISHFSVYPVPASDYICISDADMLVQAAILDVLGKEIKTVVNKQSGTLQIDISDMKQGAYFLMLTDIYGNISKRTLLKE
jgi:hypothetical protein